MVCTRPPTFSMYFSASMYAPCLISSEQTMSTLEKSLPFVHFSSTCACAEQTIEYEDSAVHAA